MLRSGIVCEHGYEIRIIDGAVRHMSTRGVCLEQDANWRDLFPSTAAERPTDPALLMDAIEAAADA